MTGPPRVFISYSHDDKRHEQRVLALANRLRTDGIDAEIDQYEPAPPEGWPTWCDRQIQKADYVLLVCSETYFWRVYGEEAPGVGHGFVGGADHPSAYLRLGLGQQVHPGSLFRRLSQFHSDAGERGKPIPRRYRGGL
jgi:hypothetical protein